MKKPRKSKYGNIKTRVDGILFDSKKEAKRYLELKLLEKAGRIVTGRIAARNAHELADHVAGIAAVLRHRHHARLARARRCRARSTSQPGRFAGRPGWPGATSWCSCSRTPTG